MSLIPGLAKRGPHDMLDLLIILGAPCPHCGPAIEAHIRAFTVPNLDVEKDIDWHLQMMTYRDELESGILEMADRITELEKQVEERDALVDQLQTLASTRKAAKQTTEDHLSRGLASLATK